MSKMEYKTTTPRKVWFEIQQDEGWLIRKGWKNRRLFNAPRDPKRYKDWSKRKFDWGVNRYKGTGYKAVVKAAFGDLAFVCYESRLFRSRKAAKRVGTAMTRLWKAHWNSSTATEQATTV